MNRIFRIIWSRALHTWVVASELATRRGKDGGGVDRRTAAGGIAPDHLIAGHAASPWPLRLGILAALTTLYAPAHAADRYWDVNGTSIGNGGTGTWDTTSAFWSPNNDGVSGPYSAWNNAALYDAYFGGTAGTVTLGTPIAVHNLTFLSNGYTLTGSTLTLAGTTPTINTGNGAVSQTINSIIAGSAGLTKAGTGTLVLNGTNTFIGDIHINAGSLSVGAIGDAALGDAANQIFLGNGMSLASSGTLSSSRTVNLTGGISGISGAGVGGVYYTGVGGLSVADGVSLTNNANDYQGRTQFTTPTGWSGSYNAFSSIADLGVASALGAPTTVANGTIVIGRGGGQDLGPSQVFYTGTGSSSNRNWQMNPGSYAGSAYLYNAGSGTLRLTGNINGGGAGGHPIGFNAQSADMELLGVISANDTRSIGFTAGSGHTIRLGVANTFTGAAAIGGAGTVEATVINDIGVAGSLGAGSVSISGGNLSYLGAGEATNKNWSIANGSLNSNGTGALALSGTVAIGGTATLGGNFTGADNVISGVVSGTGSLRSAGNATWTLTGANTYTGSTIVNSGVLRAGTAGAFGASTTAQVNGGTLDLNDFDRTFTTLTGTGGIVDLGSATLTLQAASGTTASYAGNITGTGGLTKLGASTQTLTGANTYTGATTVGGGVLALDFSTAGGPTSNIIGSSSTLDMAGGRLNVIGAAGETNTQTFNGLNVSASNNTIDAKSGTGGNLTVNLGAINRTGGLINFNLPTSGHITTSNTTLGGWATVNGTDYAKVVGGNITAFTPLDYTNKDNAANWLDGEYITDSTGFFNTVSGTKQLAGLRYTVPKSTTVTVSPGQTLGVDGTIIVAPSVLNTNQVITGGMMTGANGGDLGIQQNSTGNFTIASQIVDNGAGMGFVKAGTGLVTLSNAANSYTGATRVAQGTLSVSSIKDGGVASGIGASSAASSNLVLEGATLTYTGTGDTSDRGFTFAKSGAIVDDAVQVTDANANLTFSGLVTSPDGANFTKSGAGTLTLANATNDFTGIVTVTGGLLGATTLADGGQVSSIGAGSSASSSLVLNGGGLQYTGGTTSTNRGFTLGTSGGTVDVTAAATTLTVSGIVAGPSGRLTKNGAGTLVLSGANTYTGGNTVNAGILRAGAANAFGALTASATNLANTAGVVLDLNNFDNMIGPLNGGGANGGNVTLGSGTLRIASGNGNYSGVISGTGGVWRTNGNTQTFNGCNNTYTGATTLDGANITTDCLANGGQASGIGASSSASTNLVFKNGALNYTGGTVGIDRGFNLTGYGIVTVTNAATTLGFSGQVIGGGEFYKDGAGTMVLSGNNTYTNNTHVRGGILRAGSATAFGTTNSFWMDNTAGVLLDLNNFNANAGALIGGGALGGNIAMGTGTLTIRDGLNQTYAGAISGTGNLIKNGAGTQALSGCNSSYTGPTAINAGVLQVTCLENGGVASSIGASSAAPANLTINGTLRYVGAGSSTDRQFTLGTSGGTLDASGTGIVEFTNTAAVTLAGANTARTMTLTGTNTDYNLFAGQLDNNGAGITSLTKTGTGTWRLTNANSTYTGVTRINGGILSVDQMANGGQASSIGAASTAAANLVIGNGSTLRYTGDGDATDRQFTLDTGVTFIESSGTGALQFTNTGAVALLGTNATRTIALGGTNTGANTMGGAMGDNGTGKTTLAKNDSGTWILTGNNTYTGNTVINDGNLMIGNGGTTGNAGAGNVIVDSPTSTLSLNRSDTFTFSGTLSGPGTLAQVGSGTSVLTSTTNQIGATTISNGTLQVDGALETPTVDMSGTSALTVNGTVQAAGPAQTVLTGDAGDQTITVGSGGTLLASGDLGDGSDTIDLTGTLNTGSGTLGLGAGDDTLALHDGSQMLGAGINASGGGGTDTLVVDTALGYTLDGGAIDTFDILTKQNSGTLTLTGDHDFGTATHIDGGTLSVEGTLTTPTLSMADDTTLNVDGSVEGAGGNPVTITGSAGDQTINVNSGSGLAANGDLGDGADTVTLASLLNTGAGTLGLGDGDDTLTLQDGAVIAGAGVDAGAGSTDQLVLDNAADLTFDGSQTAGFETLLKQNAGTATMTGSQSFSSGTTIADGALDVVGTLETPTIDMADDTALNVDGTVQAAGGTQAAITGSAGANTVSIGVGGTLLASGDLGTGNDVLDVAGTLDTGSGVFALGDGDDTLTIHDGTHIIGTVSAGAGNDTFDTHIDTVADLGAVQGFETLAKTGSGVLNINGPLSSDFNTVNVEAGTLDVTAGGSVVGSPGIPLTTTVAAGATLNVDGSYGCSAESDTMTVAGTVSGSGTIDLCGGDDTLTLQDGAVLNNTISGGTGTGDTLVLDNANALAFDAGNTTNFELLQKDNVGEATLSGSQTFDGGMNLNDGTLTLDGAFEAPSVMMADDTTLNVNGTLDAGSVDPIYLVGSTGVNTLNVAAGATLTASGDLGDGADLVDVAGTLDTGTNLLELGDGSDTLTIHDGSAIAGIVDGGLGSDTFNTDINTVADLGAVQGFETLDKTGSGTLNINGPASSDFTTVNVLEGTLDVGVAGSVIPAAGSALATTVASGATLNVDGSYGCSAGDDSMTVAGTVSGSGSIDLCGGDDTLTLQDGADLSGLATTLQGGAGNDTLLADIAGSAVLGGVGGFETLQKDNVGTLQINGPAPSDFTAVRVNGGTLEVGVDGSVSGVSTTTVADGATLDVDGSYAGSAGDDSMDVSGTIAGTGSIDLGDGDDTLTLNDGAVLDNAISGGTGTGDTLVLDNANALAFDAGNTTNFELLQKNNTGEATLTGTQTFSGGSALNGGTLTLDGDFQTPTMTLGDGTILNVNGSLEAGGGTAAVLTGSAGVNTITVAAGGTLLASGDLGGSDDTLDVAGTLDTGGGVFALGDGNDNFVVHDGTVVLGTIDGGAGLDTRTYDINTSADLGALVNFEGVTKTGTGVLNINGPGATDLQDVQVLEGTLDVAAGASIVAAAGSPLATTVAAGATLNVDGSYGCGAGNDTMDVSGTVSGSGTINLCGGDDTLTLNDGADLSGLANPIDGDAGTGDTVVLNNAGAMTLDAGQVANFEVLQKDNAGEATLTGMQTYSGGTTLNGGTLTVAGLLQTPTVAMADDTVLNVDGLLAAGPGTAAVITGSAGVNTVNVAAGALLAATGDLGDGNDVFSMAGTLDTAGGTFSLGAGDDIFQVFDTTNTAGATVDGGAGNDTLDVNVGSGNTVPLGSLLGFESLGKSGQGTLEIHGPSDFIDVAVNEGILRVTDTGSVSATTTTILTGATLELADAGNYTGTSGADTFTVAGTVLSSGTGAGTIDLGDGDDTFTIQDGADLSGLATPVSGGAGTDTFVADLAGSAVLGGAIDFETLTKTNVGTLHVNGPAMSAFSTVNVDGGTLDVGVAGSLDGVQVATVASGAGLKVDGSMQFTPGADTFTVAGNVSGVGTIDMLDGDDNLILQDGADLSGLSTSIDGGAGNDTLTADIAGTATLGGATHFETLTKTNTGTLTVAGPAPSDFTTVNVDGGTLDVGVAGSLSGVVTTTVASGATLNVDGSVTGSAGDDTMTVAGAISGNGTIAFDDGDDVLTLNDGADLSGFSGTLDGGAHSGGDSVVLNNASALSFGAGPVINFEYLSKTNSGTATLTGNQSYSGGTSITGGTLAVAVAGTLETPTVTLADDTTLSVDGTLAAGPVDPTILTGSAGTNTVTIGAGGTALATGDLGAGADVLDVLGTLDTAGGSFALGDGDDNFIVHDGTVVTGTVDGGAGLDTRTYDINATADLGALVNFEGVTKTGTGVLNINGPGTTDLQQVSVLGGTLNIGPAGSVAAIAGGPLDTVVASGATLNVDGSFGCGDSADTMTVAGTVSGTGTIDLCGGDDTLTLQDGAVLANTISGGNHGAGDTVVLDNADALSFDASHTINFEFLQKDNAGEATLTGTQAFSGGTTLNGGTLSVAGQLDTPSVAMGDDTVLNVDGTLQAAGGTAVALSGSAGVNTVNVAAGGTLLASGDLGDGNDVVDVAGTLDTAGGALALGVGDDTLTIHDGTTILGTVDGGAGNDTFNADIATVADLGAVQTFETLSKTGAGVLNVNGPASSDFTTVNVLDGRLDVTANGSIAAQATTVAAGATLQVEGHYTGTSGDDTFTSMGTVSGAFDFGTGNDAVAFVGGDPSGVTALDGGAGTDQLSFSGLTLESATLPTLAGWERVELLNDSALTLDAPLDLSGGVLAIDATSQLTAHAGAALGGSVENAGLIDVGANRLAISGDYSSNNGTLQLTVSPENLSTGGLDIDGDVRGTTAVSFGSDGSKVSGAGKVSILVIASPNDNPATAGNFVPASTVDGAVRLDGSLFPWTFAQEADHNWYLNAQAGLLPEIPAYAVLPTLGTLMARQSDDIVHQRMTGIRDSERPSCGHKPEQQVDQAGTTLVDDCRGFWVAATGSDTNLGANPGFAADGSDVGLYGGFDYAAENDGQTVRLGVFMGYLHGNYWTSGVNSTALPGIGAAGVRLDTTVGGWYGSLHWTNGAYVDTIVSGQSLRARVRTTDGFTQSLAGGGVTVSAKAGRRYRLDSGWSIDPYLQMTANEVRWDNQVDGNGRQLTFTNNWVSTARAALRVEKLFTTDGGATIKPWVTLAVEKAIGQTANGLQVAEPGANANVLALPNQDLGTTVRLDAGVEAKLNAKVSLFGVLSASHSLHGSDYRERAANVGVRVRW